MIYRAGIFASLLLFLGSCSSIFGGDDGPTTLSIEPSPINFQSYEGSGTIQLSIRNPTDMVLLIDTVYVDSPALSINGESRKLYPDGQYSNRTTRNISYDHDANEDGDDRATLTFELKEGVISDNDTTFQEYRDERISINLPDKRVKENLSDHPSNNYPVSFSPDGNEVLFYSDRSSSKDIFIADVDNGSVDQLTDDEYDNIPVAFGEDSDFILMHSNRNGSKNIYELNRNGDVSPILETDHDDIPVSVYGDNHQILFQRDGTQAWHYDIDEDEETELAEGDFTPVMYVEDQDYFLLHGGEGHDLAYTFEPDGDTLEPLTEFSEEDTVDQFIPVDYQPDHQLIVAYSDLNRNRAIYTISANGSDIQEIVSNPRNNFPVSFTDDGDYILFKSDGIYNNHVHMVNRSGTSETQITTSDYNNVPVDVGPDSETILFRSNREEIEDNRYYQVYITDF